MESFWLRKQKVESSIPNEAENFVVHDTFIAVVELTYSNPIAVYILVKIVNSVLFKDQGCK